MNNSPHIRWLMHRDIEAVLSIEQEEEFGQWSDEDFLRNLRRGNVVGMVIEDSSVIVGFMIYELSGKSLSLLKLRVPECESRNGFGSAMIDKLIGKLSMQKRSTLTVDVDERRTEFLCFLREKGFKSNGIYDGYIEMNYTIEGEQELQPVNRISQYMEGDQ